MKIKVTTILLILLINFPVYSRTILPKSFMNFCMAECNSNAECKADLKAVTLKVAMTIDMYNKSVPMSNQGFDGLIDWKSYDAVFNDACPKTFTKYNK